MATFTVTNLFDSGSGSLRDFISTANESDGADIVDFNTSLEGGSINLTGGELGISDDLTINGLGADQLSVDAGGNSSVFSVSDSDDDNSIEVAINGLTITGGSESSGGGGIFNSENLTVSNSTISGNTTANGSGGGINNDGALTVSNSTISRNSAYGSGGGIENFMGNVTVSNSTISGNSTRFGGGINNFGGNVAVGNSTISSNSATSSGGGIENLGSATITSSIIATNTDDKDVSGTFTSGGNNLIGNGDRVEGFTNEVGGDLVGTVDNPIDPLLGELQDNGGPTQTQALLPGSPAINAGSNPLNLEFDQRGPGFDRVIGAQADIGAFEVVPEPSSTLGLFGVALLGVMFLRKGKQKS